MRNVAILTIHKKVTEILSVCYCPLLFAAQVKPLIEYMLKIFHNTNSYVVDHIRVRAQHVSTLSPVLPLSRLDTASEIADAYLYIISNSYTTDSVIVVDGGATC